MKPFIRVSLVEDDPGVRENIAGYLNSAADIRCVSSYATADEALAQLPHDAPDVVLMDINFEEGLNGIQCVQRLKPVLPKSQILMLTVFEDTDRIFRALAAGASGYLLKRMPPAQLLEAIREVHGGGAPMSASIARKVVQSFQSPQPVAGGDAELSAREREVLLALAEGCPYKQIGDRLGVSIHTVRNYVRRIYEKLHVHTRTEAVAKFYRQ